MLISNYNPQWPVNFEKLKSKLSEILFEVPVRIEHVGSTSIPFCGAKPIIDIDIIYAEDVDFIAIKVGLEKNGYYHNGDQGITGREVFKRNGKIYSYVFDTITHHLYVFKSNNFELSRHLHFRDYLKQNEMARNFYEKLKREIALETNNDKKRYAELKQLKVNSFIDYVIELQRKKLMSNLVKATNALTNISVFIT